MCVQFISVHLVCAIGCVDCIEPNWSFSIEACKRVQHEEALAEWYFNNNSEYILQNSRCLCHSLSNLEFRFCVTLRYCIFVIYKMWWRSLLIAFYERQLCDSLSLSLRVCVCVCNFIIVISSHTFARYAKRFIYRLSFVINVQTILWFNKRFARFLLFDIA